MNYRENIEKTISEFEDIGFEINLGQTVSHALSWPIDNYLQTAIEEIERAHFNENMYVYPTIEYQGELLEIGCFDLFACLDSCIGHIADMDLGYESDEDVMVMNNIRDELESKLKKVNAYLESLNGRDSQAHEKAQG